MLALPLARIALSKGRRAALSTGYAIGAAGRSWWSWRAVTRSLPLVLIGCFFVGVASASSYQARYAATDLATEEHRARALSWVVWAGTVGAVLGPNLLNASGNLGLSLGLPQLSGPYVVAAVCLSISALVLLVFLRPDPYLTSLEREAAAGEAAHRPRLRDGIEHLRGRPRAVLGIAAIAIGHVVMVMVMVMTPVHMAHVDVTLQLIGLVISVHVAGMYALSPVVGWAVDRYGRVPVIVAGIAILDGGLRARGPRPGRRRADARRRPVPARARLVVHPHRRLDAGDRRGAGGRSTGGPGPVRPDDERRGSARGSRGRSRGAGVVVRGPVRPGGRPAGRPVGVGGPPGVSRAFEHPFDIDSRHDSSRSSDHSRPAPRSDVRPHA